MFTQGWCVISSLFLWHSWPSWLGTWLWNALKETQTSERCQSASWLGFGNRMNREYALFSVMKCDQEQPPNWRLPIHTYTYTHTRKHAPFLGSFSAAESTFYKVCFLLLGTSACLILTLRIGGQPLDPFLPWAPWLQSEHSCLFVMSARWINKCVLVFLLVICG